MDMTEVVKKRQTKHSRPRVPRNFGQLQYPPNLLSNNDLFIGYTVNHQDHWIENILGGTYPIKKGTLNEHSLWCVKDSTRRNGRSYYFDRPEDAERILQTTYQVRDKQKWYKI